MTRLSAHGGLALAAALTLTLASLHGTARAQTSDASEAAASEEDATAAEQAALDAAIRPASGPTIRLAPGLLYSYGGGARFDMGVGVRLRLDVFPFPFGLRTGAFMQGELLTDGSVRAAAGLAGGMWLMGCEVGISYRSETHDHAASLGFSIGKTIELGPFALGARVTFPLHDFVSANGAQLASQGIEVSGVVVLQWPQLLSGPEPVPCACRHRR